MKTPLTREQIQAIQDRNFYSTDIRTLLWEIKRLRALTLRTHDYFRQAPGSSTAQTMAEHLLAALEEEPVVKEQPRLK